MISVIIPLYNKALCVRRAVVSVLRQTMRDFECIVVDDGSTDGGGDLVQQMGDPRIRLLRQPNGGVSRARNKAIELARYPLVAFLDADDEWLPGFLEASSKAHREYPGIVASFTNYQREPGGNPVFREIQPSSGVLNNYFTFCLRHKGCGMCSSAVMGRRDILTAIGGFPIGRPMGEDLDTWFRLACAGSVAYLGTPLAIYHQTAGATAIQSVNSDVWPTYRAYARSNRIPMQLASQAELWAAFTRIYTVKASLRRRGIVGCNAFLYDLPLRLWLHPRNIGVLLAMWMPARLRHSTIAAAEIIIARLRGLSPLKRRFAFNAGRPL